MKSFMVSNDGVVHGKDLGQKSIDAFQKMERFNPDETWIPVPEEE